MRVVNDKTKTETMQIQFSPCLALQNIAIGINLKSWDDCSPKEQTKLLAQACETVARELRQMAERLEQ